MSDVKTFVLALVERAVEAAAAAALATIGADAALSTIQWEQVGSVAGGAALIVALKCIATGSATGQTSLGAEQLKPPKSALKTKTATYTVGVDTSGATAALDALTAKANAAAAAVQAAGNTSPSAVTVTPAAPTPAEPTVEGP